MYWNFLEVLKLSETCYVENIKSTNFVLVQTQNPRTCKSMFGLLMNGVWMGECLSNWLLTTSPIPLAPTWIWAPEYVIDMQNFFLKINYIYAMFIKSWKKTFVSISCQVLDFQQWVSNCYLMPNEQFFSHIMARTSCILTRWCLLCSRPTNLAIFLLC